MEKKMKKAAAATGGAPITAATGIAPITAVPAPNMGHNMKRKKQSEASVSEN